MISFTKITLFVVCCTVLTDVSFGQRESINENGGGSGGGSVRRNNNKAVNSSSATSVTNIASNVGNNAPNVGYNSGNNSNAGTTINNSGSSSSNNVGSSTGSTSSSSSSSNNSGTMSNFGDHGTLADRNTDVMCHICNAVPDKSYDPSVRVAVSTSEQWSCGYMQETVQDVDPNSLFEDERHSCRQTQLLAENNGCCSQTMYINQPGRDFNDPCFLCGSNSVAPGKSGVLVNTGIVGTHTCGTLDMIMKQNIFSANLCPSIISNVASTCCTTGTTARSSESFLRGAALGPPQ